MLAAAALVRCTMMIAEWANPYDSYGNPALLNISNIPRSVGIIVFCFAGHPCFPAVRANMKNSVRWGSAVNYSFFLAFIFYASFGILGYIVFGADLHETVMQNLSSIEGVAWYRTV